MPKNKNQHYVPQFYLKFFSRDNEQKTIGIWNIEKEIYIEAGSIKQQASEDYFYGQDPELEHALWTQEALLPNIFRFIIEKQELFMPNTVGHFELLAFVLAMYGRTKYAAEKINEGFDKMTKNILKHDLAIKDKLDSLEFFMTNAPLRALENSFLSIPLAMDLKFKLIVNKTQIPFILSDNPIILHNQFLRDKKWPMGRSGIAQIGLQILMPVSPKHLIIFYDSKIYKVGNKKDDVIGISDFDDVNMINEAQFLNANKVIFFNEQINENYCIKLSSKSKKNRISQKAILDEFGNLNDPKRKSKVLSLSQPQKNIDVRLSFIKTLKKSKKIALGPSTAVFRDPKGVENHRKFMGVIKNQKRVRIDVVDVQRKRLVNVL